MVLKHLLVIHLVDVITSKNQNVVWSLLFDRVNVLVDRVGGALVPLFVDALLRRNDVNEFAKFATEKLTPTGVDMPVEAHRFVLSQQQNFSQAAVEAI